MSISVEYLLKIFKMIFISIFTYYVALRFINKANDFFRRKIVMLIYIIIISTIFVFIKEIAGLFYSIIFLIVFLALLLSKVYQGNIGYSILIITVSLSINYILFSMSVILIAIINIKAQIDNSIVIFIGISMMYFIIINVFLKIKRLRNGLYIGKNSISKQYLDVLILNISVIIIFTVIMITDYNKVISRKVVISFMIFAILMFITIQKSLQLYYKQKQLIKTLEETQAELEEIKKDNKQLEQENIEISKRSHSLVHKQKSLEYKLNELIAKTEESKQIKQQENSTKGTSKIITITEQETEIKSRLENISKEIFTEKATIELDKTEIENIDDMLKYQQAECIKNKIEFELQIKGNIHYMVNNLISKEDLEILIADHIKDAIIAINHSENENRNILLRIGKIDENYGIYIYDSGIEFEKETLENLGKKPSTTHTKDGGTGMGFMNTFDILRKSKASLIIREIGKPRKDNFTKVIMIKFDNKEIYKVTSYRKIEIEKSINIEKENKEEIKI